MAGDGKKSGGASSTGSLARLIDLFASEYGWSVDEILDRRTINELITLAKAIERRTREKRVLDTLNIGADRDAVRKELARIDREYAMSVQAVNADKNKTGAELSAEIVKGFFER